MNWCIRRLSLLKLLILAAITFSVSLLSPSLRRPSLIVAKDVAKVNGKTCQSLWESLIAPNFFR